jgi:hypothetical protein
VCRTRVRRGKLKILTTEEVPALLTVGLVFTNRHFSQGSKEHSNACQGMGRFPDLCCWTYKLHKRTYRGGEVYINRSIPVSCSLLISENVTWARCCTLCSSPLTVPAALVFVKKKSCLNKRRRGSVKLVLTLLTLRKTKDAD